MAPRSRLIWPFSIPDWKRDTPQLTQAECTGYLNLLMFYWEHGGLPDEDAALRRIAGAEPGVVWSEQRRRLKKFFHDGWKHKRMDADLTAAARYSARQRASARRRWHPVETVDNQNNVGDYTSGRKRKRNQRRVDAVGMPRECSLVKQDKLPSISGSPVAVNKWPSNKQADSKRNQAEQAWQNNLLHSYSREEYARAIDLLAADPDLVEQATQSELKEPGTGHVVAMLGLSVREVGA